VVGAWKGEPLDRPEELPAEERQELYAPPHSA
jgi:hypothetical protein